jgi:hypothetical protein
MTCVKVPSRSQEFAALQGVKQKSSPSSWSGSWRGRCAASCRHLLLQDGGEPGQLYYHAEASCTSMLQATKSSSLTVKTVQVEGGSAYFACGMWHCQAPSVTGRQTCHMPCRSQPGTPWHTCNQTHGDCTFHVKGSGQGRGSHLLGLPAMPVGEASQAVCISSPCHPCASTQVLPCAGGPGRPSAMSPLMATFTNGQGCPVHLCFVDGCLHQPGHQAHAHHSLPP